MPIFVLECQVDGYRFETLEKRLEDAQGRPCPKCDSTDTQTIPATFGNYTINGNNSASTRPSKARSNQ